jgi:hypothetical protein
MVRSNQYFTLVGSLPSLPSYFDVERPPINRVRLEERLKMLQPRDADRVERIAEFLVWDRQQVDVTDEEVIDRYEQLLATNRHPLMREMISTRFEVRTVMAGLRRRRKDLTPPVGIRPLSTVIDRNWDHPTFKLEHRFPWIAEMDALLGAGDLTAVQRLLHDIGWRHWGRLAQRYSPFSFEAVLLYLIRWEIVYRWTRRDAPAGARKFAELVTETLGEYANLPQ